MIRHYLLGTIVALAMPATAYAQSFEFGVGVLGSFGEHLVGALAQHLHAHGAAAARQDIAHAFLEAPRFRGCGEFGIGGHTRDDAERRSTAHFVDIGAIDEEFHGITLLPRRFFDGDGRR